jgi:hypothetical protein
MVYADVKWFIARQKGMPADAGSLAPPLATKKNNIGFYLDFI